DIGRRGDHALLGDRGAADDVALATPGTTRGDGDSKACVGQGRLPIHAGPDVVVVNPVVTRVDNLDPPSSPIAGDDVTPVRVPRAAHAGLAADGVVVRAVPDEDTKTVAEAPGGGVVGPDERRHHLIKGGVRPGDLNPTRTILHDSHTSALRR